MTERSFSFYFDFGSPTAYLASTQVEALAARTGARLDWKPVLLGGIFQATGNQTPASVPAKGVYMNQKDLPRFARRYGVPLAMNPWFPINTLALMRMASAVQMQMPARLPAFVHAVFHAMWAEPKNMGDPAIAAAIVGAAGFDAAALGAAMQDPAVKDRLKQATEAAVGKGLFGAPSFLVGDELFFGQDRLDFVEEALKAA